jgi:ribosomal protein S18 acetylase RimI-like enzyme
MQRYLFYSASSDSWAVTRTRLSADYYTKLWVPKIFSIAPRELMSPTFFAWWLFHWIRVFKNPNYRIFLVYTKDNLLAHSTVLLPAHFRFPFMRYSDLQIGPVDTRENHKRKGLALYVISNILKEYENTGVRLWYITRTENDASKKLIEGVNFRKIGEGKKIINKYNRLLSYFDIDHHCYQDDQ